MRIEESNGKLIRSFTNNAKEKKDKLDIKEDKNRFIWDMRYDGFKEFKGLVLYSSPNRGPKAIPGVYLAKLIVDDKEVEQEFEIIKDPRLDNTHEDFKNQFDYLISVRDKVSEAHQAIIDIRSLREDIEYFKKKFAENEDFSGFLKKTAELDKEMAIIENNIHMTKNQSRQDPLNYGIRINNRLAFLMADQQRGDYPPTDQAIEFKNEVSAELEQELTNLDKLLISKLTEINTLGNQLGVKIISSRASLYSKP